MNERAKHPANSWSMKNMFLAVSLILTISIFAFSTIVVYLEAEHESEELFDHALEESAHLLLALAGHEVVELSTSAPQLSEAANNKKYASYLVFQIWNAENQLLYKSADAPAVSLAKKGALGFAYTSISGQQWRTYTTWNATKNLRIEVSEPYGHRKEISTRFLYKLLLFAALTIPLIGIGVWWAIGRILRSLRESAVEVQQRTPDDLRKVDLDNSPREVLPLLNAINQLFERVSRTLDYEQRFTSDAAHELRTPLAAIKTNAQVIQRARNDDERNEAIKGLDISVTRATRLVDQLLTLARLDPKYDKNEMLVATDFAALLSTQLPSLHEQAEQSQLHLHVHLQPAVGNLHRDSFLILFRNLMDNAFRYTQPGGDIRLSCHMEDNDVCLTIADSGVGIPAEMRERVFDRFVRLSDASTPGSGLGLSIVKKIIEIHHGKITLENGLNQTGLSVEIRFPSSAPQPPQTATE